MIMPSDVEFNIKTNYLTRFYSGPLFYRMSCLGNIFIATGVEDIQRSYLDVL
jgi:hypothetical protein